MNNVYYQQRWSGKFFSKEPAVVQQQPRNRHEEIFPPVSNRHQPLNRGGCCLVTFFFSPRVHKRASDHNHVKRKLINHSISILLDVDILVVLLVMLFLLFTFCLFVFCHSCTSINTLLLLPLSMSLPFLLLFLYHSIVFSVSVLLFH